jgi:HEAT repeat protein
MASMGDDKNLPEIIKLLSDPEPAVRYWAATGCVILGIKAGGAIPALIRTAGDPSVNVRIASAEALYILGEKKLALQTLLKALSDPVKMARVHAFNVLDIIGKDASSLVQGVEKIYTGLINDLPTTEYDIRSARYFLGKHKPH